MSFVSLRHYRNPPPFRRDGTLAVETSENIQEAAPPEGSWRCLARTQEACILLAGLACAGALVVWFLLASDVESGKRGIMLAVLTAHLTGGRASGIAVAVNSRHFRRWETILFGSLVEGAVVCLFFAVFSLSFKKLIRIPFLVSALANVHRSAETQRARMLKWGIPGLILFVWFPFLMTGPVVGSVIGFLLGMRPWVVISVVMFGTISAIVSWTFIMDQIAEWTSRIGDVIPLLFVCLLLGGVISYRIRRLLEPQTPPPRPPTEGNGST